MPAVQRFPILFHLYVLLSRVSVLGPWLRFCKIESSLMLCEPDGTGETDIAHVVNCDLEAVVIDRRGHWWLNFPMSLAMAPGLNSYDGSQGHCQ